MLLFGLAFRFHSKFFWRKWVCKDLRGPDHRGDQPRQRFSLRGRIAPAVCYRPLALRVVLLILGALSGGDRGRQASSEATGLEAGDPGSSGERDANGNMTTDPSSGFSEQWNSRNQLVKSSTASFAYDAFGRRVNVSAANPALYDGLNLAQIVPAGVTSNVLASVDTGTTIFCLDGYIRVGSSASRRSPGLDALGSEFEREYLDQLFLSAFWPDHDDGQQHESI